MYVDNFLALLGNGEALPALETIKHLGGYTLQRNKGFNSNSPGDWRWLLL